MTEEVNPDPAARVQRFLDAEASADRLTLVAAGQGAWDIMVPSYWKETIAASLQLGDRSLHVESFFLRAPEDNAGAAYRLLLQRNARSRLWRFAAGESGDVSLVADVPLEAVDEELLGQLLGALAMLTDETYRPYFELAFEGALLDQVRRGGPGLDQPPPWARDRDRPRPEQAR